jgi:hypothetical protein
MNKPKVIKSNNLSRAWLKAYRALCQRGADELVPLLVCVDGFEAGVPQEDQVIRNALDEKLQAMGRGMIETVANTIFPQSFYRRYRDRGQFYRRYLASYPRIQALDRKKNCRGVYFERFIAPQAGGPASKPGGQLEHIITSYPKLKRRSVLQLAAFDPARDHTTGKYLLFPCLQHVTFVPHQGELTVNAFYASQCIFQKAYGNYLGLVRLGAFVAEQLKLELVQLCCYTGIAHFADSKMSKADHLALLKGIDEQLDSGSNEGEEE